MSEGFDCIVSELYQGDYSRVERACQAASEKFSQLKQTAVASRPGQFLTQGKLGRVVVQWSQMQLFMKGCQYGYQWALAPSVEDSSDAVSAFKTMLVVVPVFMAAALHVKTRLDTNHAPRETLYELGAAGVTVSCAAINPGFFGNVIAPFAGKYAMERWKNPHAVMLDSYNLREASLPKEMLFSMAADVVVPPVANIVPGIAGGVLRILFPKPVVRGAKAVLYPMAFVPLNTAVRGAWSAYDFLNKTQNRTALLRNPAAQIENQAEEQITALIRKADSSVKGAGAYAVHLCMKGFKPFAELVESTDIWDAYAAFEQNPTAAREAALDAAVQQKLQNSCPGYSQVHAACQPLIAEQLDLWIPFLKQWVREQAGFEVFRGEAYLDGMVRIFTTSYVPYLMLSSPLTEPFTLEEETDFLRRGGQILQAITAHTCFHSLAPRCPAVLNTCYREKQWFIKPSASALPAVDTSKPAAYHALLADFLRNPFVYMKKRGVEELQKIHPSLARISSHAVHAGIKGLNPFFELLENAPEVWEAYEAFKNMPVSYTEQELSAAVHQKLGASVRGYSTVQKMLEPTIVAEVNKQINKYFQELTFLDGNDRLYYAALARVFATAYIPFVATNSSLTQAITQEEEADLFVRIGRAAGSLLEHTQFREKAGEYSTMINTFMAGRFAQPQGSVLPALYSPYRELGVALLHQWLVLITILISPAIKAVMAAKNSMEQRLSFDIGEVNVTF